MRILNYFKDKNKESLLNFIPNGSVSEIVDSILNLIPQKGKELDFETLQVPILGFDTKLIAKNSNTKLLFVFIKPEKYDIKVFNDLLNLNLNSHNSMKIKGIIFKKQGMSVTLVRNNENKKENFYLFKLSKIEKYDE